MYTIQELKSSLFFDIETKPQFKTLQSLSPELAEVWRKKFAKRSYDRECEEVAKRIFAALDYNETYDKSSLAPEYPDYNEDEIYVKYAPLYAEFGKVLCVSFGVLNDKLETTLISLVNDEKENNEKVILDELRIYLDSHPELKLAGYNIKGFDIPFLVKRYLILGLKLPKCLTLRNKKPWEVSFLDLAEDWKGLSWEMAALETIALTLGLPTPKNKFNNYEMNTLLLEGKITLDDVSEYCEKDVKTVIDITLHCVTK